MLRVPVESQCKHKKSHTRLEIKTITIDRPEIGETSKKETGSDGLRSVRETHLHKTVSDYGVGLPLSPVSGRIMTLS